MKPSAGIDPVANYDRSYVVVIGGMNMDIHGIPSSRLVLKDSNPGSVRATPGGVARNIAENLARLGTDCRLLSAVGNDQYGHLLLEHGRSAGIAMQHVLQSSTNHTSTYLSVVNDSGDMHVAISDMAIIDELGPEQLQIHRQLLKEAALIVIDTNLPEKSLAWLASNVADGTLFVDAVSTIKAIKIKAHLSAVHTLKTNLIEAKAIVANSSENANVAGDGDLPKIADWFHQSGVKRLFITLGEQGVFVSDGNERKSHALHSGQGDPINSAGAGDAFMAGLAYAWLHEWSLDKTVGFATAAANVTLLDWQTNNPNLSAELVTRTYESSHAN